MIDRREMLIGSLATFASYALLREMRAAAAELPSTLSATRWVARQEELARALAHGTISQAAWHDGIGSLARSLDVAQLVAEIGRARQRDAGPPFGHDPQKRFVTILAPDSSPRRLSYAAALFVFTPDSVITPHAHLHMASAHMVIEGKVRIRTFDRVADESGAIVIRPATDRIATTGDTAAMTAAKDNVHWFAPRSHRAVTFDVIIDGLDPGPRRYVIQPLDVLGGERRNDGTIRAPLLSFAQSSECYGAAL